MFKNNFPWKSSYIGTEVDKKGNLLTEALQRPIHLVLSTYLVSLTNKHLLPILNNISPLRQLNWNATEFCPLYGFLLVFQRELLCISLFGQRHKDATNLVQLLCTCDDDRVGGDIVCLTQNNLEKPVLSIQSLLQFLNRSFVSIAVGKKSTT
jgi:hypothetical protein